tara:strand:+ start:1073 stop:1393 length:321 start_codon:yes stop_codon:yes gene_type:complete
MNLKNHPEIQIFLTEINTLIIQKEELLELIEEVTDMVIRVKFDYDRILNHTKTIKDFPLIVKPPTLRLEDIAQIIIKIEDFMDYSNHLDKMEKTDEPQKRHRNNKP